MWGFLITPTVVSARKKNQMEQDFRNGVRSDMFRLKNQLKQVATKKESEDLNHKMNRLEEMLVQLLSESAQRPAAAVGSDDHAG